MVGSAQQHKYTLSSAFVGCLPGEVLAERKNLFTVCSAVRLKRSRHGGGIVGDIMGT